MTDEAVGLLFAALVLVFGEDGDKGLGERPLGEHAAQQVG